MTDNTEHTTTSKLHLFWGVWSKISFLALIPLSSWDSGVAVEDKFHSIRCV